MISQILKLMIALIWLSSSAGSTSSSSNGVGEAWDISPADQADYYPSSYLTWPARSKDSALEVRTISATGAPIKKRSRQRRDLDSESKLERLPGSKREARLMSPEAWSKAGPAIQFQKRSNPDHLTPESYDDPDNNEEPANLPPLIRAHYAPKTDFVTSGPRGRGPIDDSGRTPGPRPPLPLQPMIHPIVERESRELALARAYPYEELYETPMYRNVVREHDFDVRIPPQNTYGYYPTDRYRSQRDYYYRGTERNTAAPHNMYDRYRDDDPNYDQYDNSNSNRYRPTPKPKRIIYYATLPEIVRKPVDLRNYHRPYDPVMRNPETHMETERPRMVTPNNIAVEPNRRPMRYPYDAYDNYVKRSSPYDRRRPPPQPFAPGDEGDRSREQERNIRGNYKDKIRSDDRPLESQIARSDDRRLPWPVQIGTEVSIKENERIPGRKIFGQLENYERYDGSRAKKTSSKSELKEDSNEDNSNSNNESNNK